ncbi:MAG: diguanylate cyclase [Planctomycetota bacterium]
MITLSSSNPAEPNAARLSLVGAMRIGGFILVLAFLFIITSYLIIQKGWIEPAIEQYPALDETAFHLVELRTAVDDELLAYKFGDSGKIQIIQDIISRHAAGIEAAGARIWAVDAAGAEPLKQAWVRFRNNLSELREIQQKKVIIDLDPRFAALRSGLLEFKNAFQSRLQEINNEFNALIAARTWILLILSAVGGIVTWAATAMTIRRMRKSLRRIGDHVSAIERGELDPKPMETFVEIAEVNNRLNALGAALERSRADVRREHAAAVERQSELEFAHELVLELSRARSEQEIISVFHRCASTALDIDRVEVLRWVAPHGFLEEILIQPGGIDIKPRIIADPNVCFAFRGHATSPPPKSNLICPAAPDPERSTLCIPMQTASGQIGVVHICAKPGESIHSIRREFAETLVSLFAPALENARLLRESMERSATDPLTGIANRRRLEEFGAKAIALSVRQSAPLSVVILDLDKFKEINDKYGHDTGDRALVAVARAMQNSIRETDLAARLGGDEFALLLPGTNAKMAVHVVERVRHHLHSTQGNSLPFTLHVSAGIAEMAPSTHALHEILANADRALYDAKRNIRGGGLDEAEFE